MAVLRRGEIGLLRRTAPGTLFAYRCTIERMTATGDDAWGHPVEEWATHLIVPCWWDTNSGRARDLVIEAGVNALVDTQRIIMDANVDVEPNDRIASVVGPDNVQVAGPLRIEEVVRSLSQTAILVQEIGAP